MLLASVSQGAEVVRIYNWSDYFSPDTLERFKAATGVQGVYDSYENNETLDVKLMARHSGYDVVGPSSHFMAAQIDAGALKVLDKSQLPNWKNLNPVLLKALQGSDPGNRHGFPYLWGSTGIGYNVEKVKAVLGKEVALDSWALIFNPDNMRKLAKCGVAIVDNAQQMLPITLNYLGLPHHSDNPEDYQKAQAALVAVRPWVREFNGTKYIADLASGDICVAVGFSGDILQAQTRARKAEKGVVIDYLIPKEGAPLWFDMLAMPIDAPDEKAGYAFMNYLLRPEVMADISNHLQYANGNEKADALINARLRSNPAIYPDAEIMSRLFAIEVTSAQINRLRSQLWTEVKESQAVK
jgi:putrescine transport system substrate-binding protein